MGQEKRLNPDPQAPMANEKIEITKIQETITKQKKDSVYSFGTTEASTEIGCFEMKLQAAGRVVGSSGFRF